MARLAAKEKVLFYPTPLTIVADIVTNIVPGVAGTILDPCCGDGQPLALLGQQLGLTSYGNELHPGRYQQARQRLDTCLNGAREFLVVEGQFSVVFDNPPYDEALGGQRMEVQHIAHDITLLTPGGLGIWIIPEPILDFSLCLQLVSDLTQVNLRRFPQPEYDRFKQVVVFGLKRRTTAVTTYNLAMELERQIKAGLPTLRAGEFSYPVVASEHQVTGFNLEFPQAADILAEVETSGVHQHESWPTLFASTGHQVGHFRPVLRLSSGHMALTIAAGVVNGLEVEIDNQPQLIKGFTRKEISTIEETETTDEGRQTILRERERLVQTITAFNLADGTLTVFDSLRNQDGFSDFLIKHQELLVETIETEFPPLFESERDMATWLPTLERVRAPGKLAGRLVAEGLLPAQQIRAAALAARLKTAKGVILVGEMGVGKTATAQAIAALIGREHWKLIVVCPAQVGEKWQREAQTVLAEFGVRVHLIGQSRKQADGQGQRRKVSKPVQDLIWAMEEPHPSVLIISYQLAKSGARWEHAPVVQGKLLTQTIKVEELLDHYPFRQTVEKTVTRFERVLCCPDCGQVLRGDYGFLRSTKDWGKKKQRCPVCGAALWQQVPFTYGGRVALADLLNRRYHGRYHLILDEAHQTKGADTDIGYASADLIAGARKVVAMTGTLYAGKASSIFYLLYRLLPHFRQLYGYSEVQRFVEHHGLQETITMVKSSDRYHSAYGYSRESVRVRELPGVSPGMVTMLLGSTAFLKLADVGLALPPYTEERLPIPLDDRLAEGLSQLNQLHETAAKLAREGNPGLLSTWLFASLGWVDCPVGETLTAKDKDGRIIGQYPLTGALANPDEILAEPLAKDQAILDLVEAELGLDRGVGLYFAQVNRRDWMGRLQKLLKARGIYSEILRQETCKPEDRERWYRGFVARCRAHGQEPVLLANGNLVKEGLDLVELPTLVETGIEYRLNDLRQRDRRSWRLTQERPVRVVFAYYEQTFQETALRLVAAKLKAALTVEGNLADGLAAMDLDDGDLMDALMQAVSQGRSQAPEWQGLPVTQITKPQKKTPKPQAKPELILDLEVIEVEIKPGTIQYRFF